MPKNPDFDPIAGHKHFAAHCFNAAWDLIEKKDRTLEDDQLMVASAHASLFHWRNRPDCDEQKLAVGYWQASRVHALIGDAPECLRLAEICFSYSQRLAPFYVAYAHEALARAYAMLKSRADAERHLATARQLLPSLKEGRERVETDLNDIAAM